MRDTTPVKATTLSAAPPLSGKPKAVFVIAVAAAALLSLTGMSGADFANGAPPFHEAIIKQQKPVAPDTKQKAPQPKATIDCTSANKATAACRAKNR